LSLLGVLRIWQLAVIAALAGVGTVFFMTASSTYVPELLAATDFTEANARLELSASTAMLAGPTLAGALIGIVGAPLALIADALSFLSSALLLRSVPTDKARTTVTKERQFRRELAEGLQV